MTNPSAYISEFIQSNFNDKVNKTTNISFYRKYISSNNKLILNEIDSKISLKASSSISKIDDYADSSETCSILHDEKDKRASNNSQRKNIYEDFKESMATIASKRRVSSDKLLSKTFSQNGFQKFSPHETPLTSFYRNAITSTKTDNKLTYFEKNNKNLKNIHQKFNFKINIEANKKENLDKSHQNLNLFSLRENHFYENKNISKTYLKTEPCYISTKNEAINVEENNCHNKNLEKPKKKNRINKVYSMQPTINNHLKSNLDHKNGSNIGNTEEEFESEEISEGNINVDEKNRIEKLEISEGIVYGQGGIPINQKYNDDLKSNKLKKNHEGNKENLNQRHGDNNHQMMEQELDPDKTKYLKRINKIIRTEKANPDKKGKEILNSDVGLLRKKLNEYAIKNNFKHINVNSINTKCPYNPI